MSKAPIKEKPVILPDTNILWHEDKSNVVHPDFPQFLRAINDVAEPCIVIPEVVRGELIFQQATSARKSFKEAQSCLGKVAAICGVAMPAITDDAKIMSGVESRFDDWAKTINAVIEPTPIANINWTNLINDAVWRLFSDN